jgi:hypothetical protein
MSEGPQEGGRDPFDLIDVPSIEDYEKALKASKSALKSVDGKSLILDMLRANYQAPNHTLTAGELAAKVDLVNFRAANLRYGNYAKELCKQLGRKPESRASLMGKRPIWIAILLRFSGGKRSSGRSRRPFSSTWPRVEMGVPDVPSIFPSRGSVSRRALRPAGSH